MTVDDFVTWLRCKGVDNRTLAAYREGASRMAALAGKGRRVEQKHIDHVVGVAGRSAAGAREAANLRKIGEVVLKWQAEIPAPQGPTSKPQLSYCDRCKMAWSPENSPAGCPYCAQNPRFARMMKERLAAEAAERQRERNVRATVNRVASAVAGFPVAGFDGSSFDGGGDGGDG